MRYNLAYNNVIWIMSIHRNKYRRNLSMHVLNTQKSRKKLLYNNNNALQDTRTGLITNANNILHDFP